MVVDPDSLNRMRLVLVIVFICLFAAIMIFDIVAWSFHGSEATASTLIHAWSKEWPLLPFLVGLIIGHLFW